MFKRKKARGEAVLPAAPAEERELLDDIAAQGGDVNFGAPTRCPNCGDFGFVESVAEGRQANRCMKCGQEWTFTRRGLESYLQDREQEAAAPKAVMGKGVLVQNMGMDALRVTREQFVSLSRVLRETRNYKKPEDRDGA